MFEIQSVFFGPLFFLQTFRKSIEPIRWEKKPDHVKKRPDGKNANLLIFYRHFHLEMHIPRREIEKREIGDREISREKWGIEKSGEKGR